MNKYGFQSMNTLRHAATGRSVRTRLLRGLAVAVALTTGSVTAAASQSLPEAKSLYAKYVAAINGTALAKLQSVRETGTFAIPSVGLTGSVEILRSQPNRSLVRIALPGVGEVMQGFDGKVGFSMNPMQGNSLITGEELAAEAEDGQFTASLGAPEFFTSQETVEKTTMGGVECYKVKLVWKSGRTTYDCFAVDSGLRVGNIATQKTPAGATEVTVLLADYKKFGDIMLPTKITQVVMGTEQVITIASAEFNQVPETAFVLPAAIKALIPGQP